MAGPEKAMGYTSEQGTCSIKQSIFKYPTMLRQRSSRD